jgi:NAD(P)-dependent dehydrogenase (short-subunit alcohol dehydrogenase family)
MDEKRAACVVVGVGSGIGAAYARRFAAEGCGVALMARSTQFSSDLAGEIAKALMAKAGELLAEPPQIEKADVLGVKLPG